MSVEDLKAYYQEESKDLHEKWENFPWHDKEAYGCLLKQIHSWVCHSADLLSLAGVNTKDFKLKRRFFKHTMEEYGHEVSSMKDIESLGFGVDSFPELNDTKLFYRNQYYMIDQLGGESFFGYVIALEGLAVAKCSGATEKINEAYDFIASRFMKLHGDEDPHHIEEAFENLRIVAPDKFGVIKENLKISLDLLCSITDQCVEYSQQRQAAA